MYRIASICLLVLVSLGLGALAISGWRIQSTFAERMDKLTEQLSAMNDTQRTLLASEAKQTPSEITGKAYLGDIAHPASGAEIRVGRFPEKDIVRRLRVDKEGMFRSGPLPEGDYFVMAALLDADQLPARHNRRRLYRQSQPIYLYSGSDQQPIEIDLKHRPGQIALTLTAPLPDRIEVHGRVVEIEIQTVIQSRDIHPLPWSPSVSLPPGKWPIVGYDTSRWPTNLRGGRSGRRPDYEADYSPQEYSNRKALLRDVTDGEYSVYATLAADLTSETSPDDWIPAVSAKDEDADTQLKALLEKGLASGTSFGGIVSSSADLTSVMSSIPGPSTRTEGQDTIVNVVGDQQTELLLEIPPGFENDIRDILAQEKMDQNELALAVESRLIELRQLPASPRVE